jgi:hypothetical protein
LNYRKWFFIAILAGALGLQTASAIYYVREQAFLAKYVDRVADSSLSKSEQVMRLVISLKNDPDVDNDSYFLLPVFRPLRPTARQVIEDGGDCADRSRLLIALLRLRGIHGSKWALYNARGESVHAVVEAEVESGRMVADPLFGLWFPKSQAGFYDIHELKQDPKILATRVADLRAQGIQPGVDRLELYPLNEYVYTNARTINWNKNALLRAAYSVLHAILGERAGELGRPGFAEEPPLMVIYGMTALEFVVVLAWFLLAKRSRRLATQSVAAK